MSNLQANVNAQLTARLIWPPALSHLDHLAFGGDARRSTRSGGSRDARRSPGRGSDSRSRGTRVQQSHRAGGQHRRNRPPDTPSRPAGVVPVQSGARPSLPAPALQIPVEDQPAGRLDPAWCCGSARPNTRSATRMAHARTPAPYTTADSNAIASAMRMIRSSRSSGRRRTSAVTRREVGKQPHHVQDDCVVFNRGWTGLDSSFLQRRPSQRGCSTSKPTGHTRSMRAAQGALHRCSRCFSFGSAHGVLEPRRSFGRRSGSAARSERAGSGNVQQQLGPRQAQC